MKQSVAKLIRKEAGGHGWYYKQLKKAYLKMNTFEKAEYVKKAKAMVALDKIFI